MRATKSPEILHLRSEAIEVRRRARQKNMNLAVRADGMIRVSCNQRRSQREILAFVDACRDFIERRRAKLAELEKLYPRPTFLNGETVLWFGERVPVEVVWSWSEKVKARFVRAADGRVSALEIVAPLKATVEERKAAVVKLYKGEARKWFAARVQFFAGVMEVRPTSLSVRGQRTLWGSCTGVGAISLNWKLLACPAAVIDYVVVHELAHIPHRNHSARFWEFVSRFDCGYQTHRKYLKSVEPIVARMFG